MVESSAPECFDENPVGVPLVAELMAKALANDIPLHVSFELINNCNLRCRHCYICDRSSRDELSLDEIKSILDQLAAEGVLFVTFTGGEPLMRKDFFEIVRYAREKEFAITLFSNGTLITPQVADQLQELHVRLVEISILGGEAATHDWVTQVKGSFDRALRGVRLLQERGVRVLIKTSLMRVNADEYEQMLALSKELGITLQVGLNLIYRRDGSAETTQLVMTPEQLLAKARRDYERMGVPPAPLGLTEEQKRSATPCKVGQGSCSIDAHGIVYPCTAIDMAMGNLRQDSFANIWHHSEVRKELLAIRVSDLTECGSCEYLTVCTRCNALAKMETGSLLGPSPQCCTLVPPLQRFWEQKRQEELANSNAQSRNRP